MPATAPAMLESYTLRAEASDWSKCLHVGKPHLYDTLGLLSACRYLWDLITSPKTSEDNKPGYRLQLAAFQDVLIQRHSPFQP
ncbi:hypothetical protein [Hymenobacter koreensis]|uniref:Uncharacterized protein n=1 Tax=Hymenobacter koreensis TaxID=1084523 RepID=A0ABP8JJV2_9BACT